MPRPSSVVVPEELLQKEYACPDCAAETGGDGLRPGTEFAWVPAKNYRYNLRRNTYCKRHQSIRSSASRKKRLASEPKDGPVWQAKRAADLALKERHPDRRREQTRLAAARYRQNHPERARAAVRAWAERNPEQRKVSQDAYRQRHKLRGVRPVRRKRSENTNDAQ